MVSPPCVNDAGQALGLGLLALHTRGILPSAEFKLAPAFHGPAIGDTAASIAELGESVRSVTAFDGATFTADVRNGPVAWMEGNAEIGPRALGHRSLLSDPTRIESKDRLNDCKRRQWWRPVAPVVLAEEAADWFELTGPSPYVLLTAEVRSDKLALIPAVTHLDGSARLQTLSADAPPSWRPLSANSISGPAFPCCATHR